ncbi:hypothetical protein HUN39_00410 [Methylocystis sp. FS]|uniref:hypothetical protein n=1 Tax=Methylocystis silviterrae TaxID=2743612 RepID=UPI0015843828|nr:hypothetical protein [Methylocystis silviterrae]NUJ78515.1 hypothetical protein [Methylocystis silviterrae]
MGKVIAFQPRTRGASIRNDVQQRDAQILFFLGVRYLRMEDALVNPQEKPAPESRGARPGGGKRRRRVRA